MKILVPVKRVVDYNVKIRLKPDGSGVELANIKMSDEPVRRDRRRGGAASKGGRQSDRGCDRLDRPRLKPAETIRTALAMGAGSWHPHVTADGIVEPLAVAKLLKGVVAAEQPGLVILGKQAIDDDCNQTGQMLAALDRPAARHFRLQGCRRRRQG